MASLSGEWFHFLEVELLSCELGETTKEDGTEPKVPQTVVDRFEGDALTAEDISERD